MKKLVIVCTYNAKVSGTKKFKPQFFYKLAVKAVKVWKSKIKPAGELNVVFVDKKEMTKLNYEWKNKNKETDVLSFYYGAKEAFGDIIISVNAAKRQAVAEKRSEEQETALLFVHGFLHLLGMDHTNKKDEKKMWEAQDKILGGVLRYSKI